MKNFIIFLSVMLLMGFVGLLSGCEGDHSTSPKGLHGWAVGQSPADGYGAIIHTEDGGATWVRQGSSEMIPDISLYDVSAIDDQNAWIVGEPSSAEDGTYGTILRTADGGKTWIRQGDLPSIPDFTLYGVSAVNNKTAWVTGSGGTILKTVDGGVTWIQQAKDGFPTANFFSVSAVDGNNAWAVGQIDNATPLIVHTTDGGNTWTREGESSIPSSSDAFLDVQAVDKNTAWGVGREGLVCITTDGGKTWVNKSWTDERACSAVGPTVDYNGVCAVNDRIAWKAIDPRGICITTDGGDHWEQQEATVSYGSGSLFYAVTAMDKNTAWVVGGDYRHDAYIVHTTDGGKTWDPQTSPVSSLLYRISFVNGLR